MKPHFTITIFLVVIAILISTEKAIGQEHLLLRKKNEGLIFCLPNSSFVSKPKGLGIMNGCMGGRNMQLEKNILIYLTNSMFKGNLGVFCKNEIALEKISPIAIRFRLGSLDYVNWMEQKPNAIKPGK